MAGINLPGSSSNRLDGPAGIFVDINFDLYVADSTNSRIQLFHLGELNGTKIVMKGLTSPLKDPRGVVIDGDGYLYIVDSSPNSRIVGEGPDGFRCLVECLVSGPGPNHLNSPQKLLVSIVLEICLLPIKIIIEFKSFSYKIISAVIIIHLSI